MRILLKTMRNDVPAKHLGDSNRCQPPYDIDKERGRQRLCNRQGLQIKNSFARRPPVRNPPQAQHCSSCLTDRIGPRPRPVSHIRKPTLLNGKQHVRVAGLEFLAKQERKVLRSDNQRAIEPLQSRRSDARPSFRSHFTY